MGYTVHYQPEENRRYPGVRKPKTISGKKILISTLLVLLLIAVWVWAEPIGNFLLPGNPQVTKTAINNMVEGMQEGTSLADAITVFCQEIITNAKH